MKTMKTKENQQDKKRRRNKYFCLKPPTTYSLLPNFLPTWYFCDVWHLHIHTINSGKKTDKFGRQFEDNLGSSIIYNLTFDLLPIPSIFWIFRTYPRGMRAMAETQTHTNTWALWLKDLSGLGVGSVNKERKISLKSLVSLPRVPRR